MFMKKCFFTLCIFSSASVFSMTPVVEKVPESGFSTTQKVLIGGAVCVGTGAAVVVAAPLVLPAATLVAVKAAVVAGATAVHGALVVAAPTVKVWYLSSKGTKYTIKITNYFLPSKEEKFKKLFVEEMQKKPFEELLKEAFQKDEN